LLYISNRRKVAKNNVTYWSKPSNFQPFFELPIWITLFKRPTNYSYFVLYTSSRHPPTLYSSLQHSYDFAIAIFPSMPRTFPSSFSTKLCTERISKVGAGQCTSVYSKVQGISYWARCCEQQLPPPHTRHTYTHTHTHTHTHSRADGHFEFDIQCEFAIQYLFFLKACQKTKPRARFTMRTWLMNIWLRLCLDEQHTKTPFEAEILSHHRVSCLENELC
jgi:hypothetical protein